MGQIGPGDIGANSVFGANLALFILQCGTKLQSDGSSKAAASLKIPENNTSKKGTGGEENKSEG